MIENYVALLKKHTWIADKVLSFVTATDLYMSICGGAHGISFQNCTRILAWFSFCQRFQETKDLKKERDLTQVSGKYYWIQEFQFFKIKGNSLLTVSVYHRLLITQISFNLIWIILYGVGRGLVVLI